MIRISIPGYLPSPIIATSPHRRRQPRRSPLKASAVWKQSKNVQVQTICSHLLPIATCGIGHARHRGALWGEPLGLGAVHMAVVAFMVLRACGFCTSPARARPRDQDQGQVSRALIGIFCDSRGASCKATRPRRYHTRHSTKHRPGGFRSQKHMAPRFIHTEHAQAHLELRGFMPKAPVPDLFERPVGPPRQCPCLPRMGHMAPLQAGGGLQGSWW